MEEPKWEGKSTAKVQYAKAEQVWVTLLHDFCRIDKYLGAIDTCYNIDGSNGLPGLIRYCSTTLPSSDGDHDEVKWCHEKLLEVNSINRCLTYEVMENNMGISSYVATLKVIPLDVDKDEDADDSDNSGCMIEWSYVTHPIEGFTESSFLSYIDSSVHSIAKNMGKELVGKD